MKLARFRVGPNLVTGSIVGESGSLRDIRLPDGTCVRVSETILLRAPASIVESKRSFPDYVIEAVAPFIAMGQPLRAGATRVLGYDRVNGVLRVTEGGPTREVPIASALALAEVAGLLALSAHRSKLEALGLVRRDAPILYSMAEAERPFHAFMKSDPFRDVSRIHRGTVVEIVGYYKGAAVVEADAETFWVPLESLSEMDVKSGLKDADYYFNLDADRNLIPDPLQYLPSKPGLGQKPGDAKPGENWNVTPILRHVSGAFAPTPELGEPVENLLDPALAPKEVRERYGALFYHYDYEQQGTARAIPDEGAFIAEDSADGALEALALPMEDPDVVREEFTTRHRELYGRDPEPGLVDQVIGAARR